MTAAGNRFAASDCVEVTVRFKCNLKCVHCMIEGTMDWLRPETDEQLDLAQLVNRSGWHADLLVPFPKER